ncbi:MAG: trigger factor [Planctomycetes bacterium]|nr:trigger factor [Planctomycetota bacterium]
MQVQIADAGHLRKQLTISYSRDEVQAQRAKVLRQLSGEVKLNGFRPGKGSTAVVEKRFGNAANQRAEELLADEAFGKAVKENKLRPIGPISNESVTRDAGLTMTVSFEVKPPITLPEPKSLGIVDAPVDISDKDVEEALTSLCKRAGQMSDLAEGETIAEDDSITISGTVTVGGTEIRKLHDFHHLVGGYPLFGKAPADVVSELKGKSVGAQIAYTATLPASFTPAEHAGKEAQVSFTIQGAQRLRAAAADDDFAKRMGVESIAKLREMMRTRIGASKEHEARQKQIKQLAEALIDKVQVDLPPKLVESALTDSVAQAVTRAESEKKSADEIEKAKAEATETVKKGVKRFLILDAIVETRGIAVSREDLEDQIRMAASQTGRKPEEIAKQLKESGQINQVMQEIREAKALEVFLDEALGRPATHNPTHGAVGHVHGPDCAH